MCRDSLRFTGLKKGKGRCNVSWLIMCVVSWQMMWFTMVYMSTKRQGEGDVWWPVVVYRSKKTNKVGRMNGDLLWFTVLARGTADRDVWWLSIVDRSIQGHGRPRCVMTHYCRQVYPRVGWGQSAEPDRLLQSVRTFMLSATRKLATVNASLAT